MARKKTDNEKAQDIAYKRDKCKRVCVRFFPSDMYVYDYIKSKDNIAGYIKGLVKADMEREGIR